MILTETKGRWGRIYGSGVAFAVIMVLLLLAAWNTGTNLLYICLGGIVSFLLLSAVLVIWTMIGLQVSREAPRSVYRGQPFRMHLRVENKKRFVPVVGLRVLGGDRLRNILGYVLKIPSQRAAVLSVEQTFDKRGVYPLPPTILASNFPFGLMERRLTCKDEEEIVVYPRVQPVRSTAVEQSTGGRYIPRSATSDGDEFFGLREYVVGDDLRRIAWRVSARLGTWIIREMSRENAKFITFALDTRTKSELEDYPERFEEAVELVASLSVTLLTKQYNVGIITPDMKLEGDEGNHQKEKVLEMLARVNPVDPTEHGDFEETVRMLSHGETAVLCVSPNPADWGQHQGVSGLRFMDPREVIHA